MYTIRSEVEVLATHPTFGSALPWANRNPEAGAGVGVFWGNAGSRMNLAEWRSWANRAIEGMRGRGVPTDKLLASDGNQ